MSELFPSCNRLPRHTLLLPLAGDLDIFEGCKDALTRGSRVVYGAEDFACLRHLETLPHATQHLLHCTFGICGPPDCFTIFIIHIGSCVYIYIYVCVYVCMYVCMCMDVCIYIHAQRLGFAPALQRRGFPIPIKYCCWEDQQRY